MEDQLAESQRPQCVLPSRGQSRKPSLSLPKLIIRSCYGYFKRNLLSVADSDIFSSVTLVDTRKIGAKVGKARAENLTEKELAEGARLASKARWEQYYRDHPEKLKARHEREARQTGKVGRPSKKKTR